MQVENPPLLLEKLCQELAGLAEVRAIGLAGNPSPLPEQGYGDFDFFVYCTYIPETERRSAVLASLKDRTSSIHFDCLSGGHWGWADFLVLDGVDTWIMYLTIQEAREEVEAILRGDYPDRIDNEFYPTGRLAMYQSMRSLYDPDQILASIKERVTVYPNPLRQKILEFHLEQLEDTEDLDRAVLRGDVLFYHFALDRALDHFLQALFALNRTYFPSRKRSLATIEQFHDKPENCTGSSSTLSKMAAGEKVYLNRGRPGELWSRILNTCVN